MNERVVLDAVIEAVPHWYRGVRGVWTSDLRLGPESTTICSHRPPGPRLEALLEFVKGNLEMWHGLLSEPVTPSQVAAIRKAVVLEWLRLHAGGIEWARLLAHLEHLKERTHENRPLARNLVITPGVGDVDITSLSVQKALDPLAGSSQVYMRVDPGLRFLVYEEVTWDQIQEATRHTYSLEFLRPFASCLSEGAFSVHLTTDREIIVLDETGLVAAERKNRWYVYDPPTLRDSLVDIVGNHHVASNLFEVIFDLSYVRRGALLVYDPEHRVVEHVVNRESVLGQHGNPDVAHQMLAAAAGRICMGSENRRDVKKRLLMELASLDGAVVFDAKELLAFGAMVGMHPSAGGALGARTTAAVSSYLYGGTPVKISADGDVCIIFSEDGGVRSTERARLQFL